MNFVGIWTKKTDKQPYCVVERSPTPGERVPGECAPSPCERALGARSPIPANVHTQASLNPAGALDNLTATSSLLVEVGT
jgi:hypothetical protein